MNTTKDRIKPDRPPILCDRPQELVIIDTHVDQWEILAAGVRPDCEVVVIHPHEDGIEQITDLLVGTRQGRVLKALHIISHGTPGTLYLGNSILNSETLQTRYSKAVQQWRHALAEDAHILIYGCNVANVETRYIASLHPNQQSAISNSPGDAGRPRGDRPYFLIPRLKQLTGAHISASTTATGSATKGGNWQLEVSTAKVQPALALEPEVMANYGYTLAGEIEWATNIGRNHYKKGEIIAANNSGNIFVTGELRGELDIDGDGIVDLIHDDNPSYNAYVAMFDSYGYLEWAKSFEGNGWSNSRYGVVTDNSGNVFVTGEFAGDLDFGGTTLNGDYQDNNVYVAKFDSSGDFIWAKDFRNNGQSYSGPESFNNVQEITTDSDGNVFVTGEFQGAIDFDDDGTYDIDDSQQHNAYVVKFDSSGNLIWANSFGNDYSYVYDDYLNSDGSDGNFESFNDVQGITTDTNGNVLVMGQFRGDIDFDGGSNDGVLREDYSYSYQNYNNAYVARFDSNGDFIWAKGLRDNAFLDSDRAIATDSNGNIFVTGQFSDRLDIDDDGNTDLYGYEPEANNGYVAKFDSNGNLIWAKGFERSNNSSSDELAIDSNGDVWVTGQFVKEIYIDGYNLFVDDPYRYGNRDGVNERNGGGRNAYLAKFDSDGDVILLEQIGLSENNSSYGITTDIKDQQGDVLITGEFQSYINFDYGGYSFTSDGSKDAYVAKFDSNGYLDWTKSFSSSDWESGKQGIATDSSGNFFVTGQFQGDNDFNGDNIPDWIGNAGESDRVAKFDSDGNLVWAKTFGRSEDSPIYGVASNYGVATDSNDNLVVTGQFQGDIDFDGDGTIDLYATDVINDNNENSAAYVAKFDSSGNLTWSKAFDGINSNSPYGVATDSNGNVVVTGKFSENALDIDGDGTIDLYGYNDYNDQTYVVNFDSSGDIVWAKTLLGPQGDNSGKGVATDSNGNVFVTGQFSGAIDLNQDGEYDDAKILFGDNDQAYLAKYDSNGDLIWAKGFNNYDYEGFNDIQGITTDSSGNVFVTGMFSGDIDLDGDGEAYDPNDLSGYPEDNNFYVAKFDSSGNLVWAEQFYTHFYDGFNDVQGITTDSSGNVLITGQFQGAIDFGGDSTNFLSNYGAKETYVAKFDSNGNLLETKGIAASNGASGAGIAIDSTGKVLVTGQFQGGLDPDDDGNYDLYTEYADTAYVVKLFSNDEPPTSADTSVTFDEDSIHTFGETDFPFTDPDGQTLQAVNITELPTVGTFTLNNTEVTLNQVISVDDLPNLSFTPVENANGTNYDSFKFIVNDGSFDSESEYTFTLNVNPVNDIPIISTVSKSGTEDTDITFAESDFIAAIADIDDDNLSQIKITSLPDNGTLKLNNTAVTVNQEINAEDIGNLTFTPDTDFNGITSFTWNGYDGIVYADTDAEVVLAVGVDNDPPILSNIDLSGDEDTDITFAESDFTAAFSDADDNSLSQIKITSLPDNGTLKLNGTAFAANQEINLSDLGNLIFTPDQNYNGTTSFSWNGFDGITYAATDATIDLTVEAVNDIPTVSDVSKTGNEDSDITFTESDFSAVFEDLVENDDLSQIKITSLPDNGTLKLNNTAVTVNQEISAADIDNFSFTPDADFNGNVSFTWNGSDGTDYADADATVNLTVNAVNDPPSFTASKLVGTVDEDAGTQTLNNWATFSPGGGSDEANQTATYVVDNISNSALFAVSPTVSSDGTLSYTPADNANGTSTFDLVVLDNGGTGNGGVNSSDAQTFTIAVNSVEDIPILSDVSKPLNEDTGKITFTESDFTAAFSDADGDLLSQIKITSLPDDGILKLYDTAVTANQEINAADIDNLSFTFDANFNGLTSFTWNASDGNDYADADATVNLLSVAHNNPPVVANSVFTQGVGFHNGGQFSFAADSYVDSDPGDIITYSIAVADTLSSSWFDGATGTNGGWYRKPKEGIVFPEVELPSWLTFDPETRTINIDEANRPNSFRYGMKVTGTDIFGASASEFIWFKSSELGGFIIDNYIAGATVFWDANKNGIRDANEPSTISDQTGEFDLNVSIENYDANNNGILDPAEGQIVAFGGIDTATGLPLETPVTATPESTVVTLLTTLVADLVNRGVSVNQANEQVVAALSIPSGVDINSLDPIAATSNNQPGGQETLVAMAKVQNAVTQISKLISGATTVENNLIVQNVIAAFTSQIQTGNTIDVSNSTQLAGLIEQAATTTQQSDPNLNLSHLQNLKADAATVIAAANQQIDNIVSSLGANSPQLQFEIAKVQFVALSETSQDLQAAGSDSKPIADVVAENTGAALEEQIEAALISTPEPNGSTPVGPAPSFLKVNLEFVLESEATQEGTENNDTLIGDSGNDIFLGLGSGDRLDGLDGDDWMNGNRGEDTLNGGLGDDTLYGGKDNDILNGDDGNDVAFGNLGNDSLTGGNGDDFLNGNQENDTLDGGNGNDTLHGGKNNDTLIGGEGEDLLSGDLGNDLLTGGNGQDIFALELGRGSDVIMDFANDSDRIGLAPGLTFNDLSITGNDGSTLISAGNELLATLSGIDVSLIDGNDFTVLAQT